MTKVLIDSSAWIHFFRQTTPWKDKISQLLLEDVVVTCGPILTEISRGARDQKEKKVLRTYFDLLPFLDLSKEDYIEAADLAYTLARKGFTLKTIDLLIAQVALKHQLILVHDESDFNSIAKYFSLKTMGWKNVE